MIIKAAFILRHPRRGGLPMNHQGCRWGLALAVLAALVLAPTAPAQVDAKVDAKLQEKINHAIDGGVTFLKRNQRKDGAWPFGRQQQYDGGSTALSGWALLEAGVPANDPAVEHAAAYIRRMAVTETKNYCISLYILFFDKLGDPEDVPLIESLALRLVQSQNAQGGWSYDSSEVPQAEQTRLSNLVANHRGGGKRPALPRTFNQLDPAIQSQLGQRRGNGGAGSAMGGDNSNTQFAMVALWVARQYGIPANPCLVRTGRRFWDTQSAKDGSWAYFGMMMQRPGGFRGGAPPGAPAGVGSGGPGGGPPGAPQGAFGGSQSHSHAMTAAGLLGIGLGVAADRPKDKNLREQLLGEAHVKLGFKYLGWVIHNTRQPDGNQFYLLWSMERVGVFYKVRDFDGADWYEWGATYLVRNQSEDGSWQNGKYAEGHCDTAFALLFLKRANPFGPDNPLDIPLPQVVEKKQRPKAKPKVEDIDLTQTIVPKDSPKKNGADKTKGPGGRQALRLDRRRDELLLGRPALRAAAPPADSRRHRQAMA
jgi:hypothetical protein